MSYSPWGHRVRHSRATEQTHAHKLNTHSVQSTAWFCYYVLGAVLCLVTQSGPTLCDIKNSKLPGSSVHRASPGKNTGGGCYVLFQGIFPTKGLNSGLPHCRRILYHLSQQGSPRIREWVSYPFSRGSLGSPALQEDSLLAELPDS